MRILLTGKDGQIGFDLHKKLLSLGKVIATSRKSSICQTLMQLRNLSIKLNLISSLIAQHIPLWIKQNQKLN